MLRLVLSVVACATVRLHISAAFTCPSFTSSSFVCHRVPPTSNARTQSPLLCSRPSIDNNGSEEDHGIHRLSTTQFFIMNNNNDMDYSSSLIGNKKEDDDRFKRIRTLGKIAWERMDTLRAAGLYDLDLDNNHYSPVMYSGFKTNVGLLIGAFMFKWYRARFINKIPVWDRQPQW
jgi:hypothetical protein